MYIMYAFISHSWAHSEHYDKLSEWLFEDRWNFNGSPLHIIDMSVPEGNPVHTDGTVADLREAIYARIFRSDVVIIPTGMYANYSKWIQREIDGAAYYHKPIVAVTPWGQQRESSYVAGAAHRSVGWNSNSVLNAACEVGFPRLIVH